MKLSTAITVVLANRAFASFHKSKIDYNSAPPNLSTLANASLFETWRPRAHLLPPSGKIGDPCGQYTDPKTGLFHVGWLHDGIAGATTDDLATYKDLNPNGAPSIIAGGRMTPLLFSTARGIDGMPTLLYTSVSYLPIHWSIPYTRGSETQSLAVSYDGGRNFTKLDQGPMIPSPPFAVNVTAFRDPYAFQSPALDTAVNSTQGTWYTAISGGVHDVGPCQFLYRQHDADFQYWEYLGQWWNEPVNTTWGNGDWAGGWGFNFEVGNVFSLNADGYSEDGEVFMTLGTESSELPIVPKVSSIHDMLWVAGNVTNDGSVSFNPTMAGVLDWGLSAYAAAGKILPASSQAAMKSGAPDRFISYIWLTGDLYELSKEFPTAQQNWTGTLLLPRELNVRTIPNAVDNKLSRESLASWRVVREGHGQIDLETMGISIARETYSALTSGSSSVESGQTLSKAGSVAFNTSPSTKFFVLTANISFPASARDSGIQSGFQILSSGLESTAIYYQFSNESIIVDRGHTSAAAKTTDGISSANEAGRLRLFDILQNGQEQIETLELTVVVDNGVLEIYANGRFALSTWARSWYANSTEINFFHNGVGEVTFGDVTVFEGLYDAWPHRR
ncbi:Concanavalin A-like lectin/glucanases superfamily [Penicillium concentricum]|uniref:Concanavalin A-like lectin/glucanases superfamily n=1 Tax=Penicillium concentricum TaxID=293559 RepID=A0A9W9VLA0_9EURO|nr:Concanavalin A-like lectin/glucanases superfamily [Penicillium concentricum]KAJ5385404.1 Concanavalin A-like lectin/glucanases superfamily [Penicillium concentricum]